MAQQKAMAEFPTALLWPEFHPVSAWGTKYLHHPVSSSCLPRPWVRSPQKRLSPAASVQPQKKGKRSGGLSGVRLLLCLNPQLLLLFIISPNLFYQQYSAWCRRAAASSGPAGCCAGVELLDTSMEPSLQNKPAHVFSQLCWMCGREGASTEIWSLNCFLQLMFSRDAPVCQNLLSFLCLALWFN